MPFEEFMEMAIAEAEASKTPYGAVIVKDRQVVERSGNTVQPHSDPSAHAEVNVIRKLTMRLKTGGRLESGYTLYTTCEPCAMCAAICIWSGISEIVYGVGSDDFQDENPNVIELRCQELIARSPNPIPIKGGILRDRCKQLHEQYPL